MPSPPTAPVLTTPAPTTPPPNSSATDSPTPTLPTGPFRRRSARVLLVNDEDRLLLFQYRNERDAEELYWITPGGGIDGDEDVATAAARELLEETGLVVTPETLGEPVAATGGYADLGWAKGYFLDTFFYHRVAAHDVDMSGFTDFEVRTYNEHRWWSPEEIAASTEHIVPFQLAPLVADLVAGQRPAELVVLPWHH
jgi:8-oxo-dGTP pyrophosphatase MutT (NUDIX family)